MNKNSKVSLIFLSSSIIALVIAYVLEYFFGMAPCKLCIYERITLYAAALLAVVSLLKNCKVLICMMFCSYIIGAVISFYHVGLERHWFHDIVGCTEQVSENVSVEELKNNLLNPNHSTSCDRPHYILGISLATWNLIYMLSILFLSTRLYQKENCKR
ncbi:MAG: disulfide bond formation protein B [Wolbachia endosymbiont of Tyrophagus putrescentiae]|nr:disulfide bond formation protein B [Wolbachia endosymbiont of Tyrophagus putrescentiae]